MIPVNLPVMQVRVYIARPVRPEGTFPKSDHDATQFKLRSFANISILPSVQFVHFQLLAL